MRRNIRKRKKKIDIFEFCYDNLGFSEKERLDIEKEILSYGDEYWKKHEGGDYYGLYELIKSGFIRKKWGVEETE